MHGDFLFNFQSSIIIFHYINVKMQNIPNFFSLIKHSRTCENITFTCDIFVFKVVQVSSLVKCP